MTKDILAFFDLNTIGYTTGLFRIPLSKRSWSNNIKKSKNGVSYTQFIDAKEIKISNEITLLDMFHGKCDIYTSYYIEKNPDWTPMELLRVDAWNKINHVFAVKKLADGRILFADARGITDNFLDFFEDFKFSKKNMAIKKVDRLTELTDIDRVISKKAYELVY